MVHRIFASWNRLGSTADILASRTLRVDSDLENRLVGAINAARDSDGRQRHLRNHGGRPDSAEPERAPECGRSPRTKLQTALVRMADEGSRKQHASTPAY